ncbi:MAG: hypothetical protein OXF84_11875 [Bacteroidetes bacterium]|nr:hypothetical protein [Bacteroidota bacterium]
MCVRAIVDASAFRHFAGLTEKSAGHQFRRWIDRQGGIIVYSALGKYGDELMANSKVFEILRSYVDSGRAIDIDSYEIQERLIGIPDHPLRRSDDPHILALALASRATVLFSCDKKLCQDFSNPRVIPNVGRSKRRSVPSVDITLPEETSNSSKRKKFFNARVCASC